MKLNNYPFVGWDWTELAKAWEIYIPEDYWISGAIGYHSNANDYDPIVWFIKEALSKYNGQKSTYVMRKLANDLRLYLHLLGNPATSHTYTAPLWFGMSKIEDDWTLLSYTCELIGGMWE